jgi:hypothetical protein
MPPSLRDVAHDGVLVFCVHSVKDQPQTGTSGVVHQGRRHGPSITYKITPCWVILLQPARRAAVLGQPSSLRPQWLKLRQIGTLGVHMKGVLLWLVCWARRVDPRDFCPALVQLVALFSPIQNIICLTAHFFTVLVPIN